jgi:hypothetical protein
MTVKEEADQSQNLGLDDELPLNHIQALSRGGGSYRCVSDMLVALGFAEVFEGCERLRQGELKTKSETAEKVTGSPLGQWQT